jgi:DUF4097 and DUF4098 domain-containing protein YvlB
MRTRSSVAGPLILIGIGILFLIHTFSPVFPIADVFANYWPYFLIVWGAVALIEVFLRALRDAPIPVNGISGAGWLVVLLICFAGLAAHEVRRPDTWWRRTGFDQGVQLFGEAHEFSFPQIERGVGKSPHVIIESFRGTAKVVGTDGNELIINGRKVIRALDPGEADRANSKTPVTVAMQGNTVFIRCNQDAAGSHNQVTTDLQLSVPRGASLEATGRSGDFDISALTGDVDVSGENGEIRLDDIGGNVKLDVHRSGHVSGKSIEGAFTVRGRGSDVELTGVSGQVSIQGDFNGTLALREISSPVRVESMRTQLDLQKLPGEITLTRGSLSMRDVVGPVRLAAKSTDVTLNGFTEALDLTVDKGDVELTPGRLPLSKIGVHSRSGNVELALPQTAHFNLWASTKYGDVENHFSDDLIARTEHHGAQLQGAIGTGPELNITTDRGSITVRKVNLEPTPAKDRANDLLRPIKARQTRTLA